jgi:GcrA cell cycle regulator
MNWTDERVELLKKLWGEGLSASQIAGELGGITRNAVIGKVHRLGLSGRAKSVATPSVAPRPRKPRAPSHPLTTFRVAGNTALAPVMEAAEPDVAPEPVVELKLVPKVSDFACERVTIMELRESMCRWPIGDPGREDFRFCGSRSCSGSPYCEHHAQIAYQPSSDRRRERRVA